MKNIIAGTVIAIFLLSSCVKKVEPVDSSNVTVTLNNNGAKYVTDNITVNPKDSLYFSFTITSPVDMKYVSIQKNPTNQTAFLVRDTMTSATKNSYSTTKRLVADSANGSYVYRIVAHDAAGSYIGNKDIIVTVNPDFNFYSYRFLYVPDTTGKSNKCFFSTTTGNTYSYTDGGVNSAAIDFGYYYDTTSTPTANPPKNTIYALSASRFTPYDLSTWTKNATTFKLAPSTTNFVSTFTSAGALRTAWNTGTATATVGRFSLSDRPNATLRTSFTGTIISFRTAAGKIGAININFTNENMANKDAYINVDVKVEK